MTLQERGSWLVLKGRVTAIHCPSLSGAALGLLVILLLGSNLGPAREQGHLSLGKQPEESGKVGKEK